MTCASVALRAAVTFSGHMPCSSSWFPKFCLGWTMESYNYIGLPARLLLPLQCVMNASARRGLGVVKHEHVTVP